MYYVWTVIDAREGTQSVHGILHFTGSSNWVPGISTLRGQGCVWTLCTPYIQIARPGWSWVSTSGRGWRDFRVNTRVTCITRSIPYPHSLPIDIEKLKMKSCRVYRPFKAHCIKHGQPMTHGKAVNRPMKNFTLLAAQIVCQGWPL